MSEQYTPEQVDRLVTMICNPSPVHKAAMAIVPKLYGYSERVAGVTDEGVRAGTNPRRCEWAVRARFADWLGDRVDDLGLWANGRRAARRRP